MRDFLRIFDQEDFTANVLVIREHALRQETFCAFYVRMQQHFVLPMGVIGFFQRILIVLRLAHFLILFPAEIGIGRGQLGEKLKQAVRIDVVIVVFHRARREQFRPERAAVRFGKGCFFTEQNTAFCITHDLFCVFAQIQVSGRSQKSPQFRRLFLVRQSSRVLDSGGNVVQQHFSEKLRKQGVLGRKLTQRFFQIVPRFG